MDLKTEIIDLLEHVPWSFEEGRHMYASELAERIFMMCQEDMTKAVMHYVSEMHWLKDRVDELEMELMLAEEAFDAKPGTNYGAKLNIKKRSNFRNERQTSK